MEESQRLQFQKSKELFADFVCFGVCIVYHPLGFPSPGTDATRPSSPMANECWQFSISTVEKPQHARVAVL